MDLATIIGLVLAWGAFLGSIIMEGGNIGSLVNPSAALLVFGGTLGATMISMPLSTVTGIPLITKHAFFGKHSDPIAIIKTLVGFAEKARREGLLALEEETRGIDEPFLQKGVQLAIDGTDPEIVREILETDVAFLGQRHHEGANFYAQMGGFAPTLGVIGTVSGLVHMLANLSDPGSMGQILPLAPALAPDEERAARRIGAVDVVIGGHVKFHGKTGLRGKNLAVQIERIVAPTPDLIVNKEQS